METVKGVKYFVGEEAILRQKVLQTIVDVYKAFNFEPIETPALEYFSLFSQKSGPEIESQMYTFSDKKGEKLALRPEHTISKLKAVIENKSIPKPIKAYSVGPVWRYEDVSKGRYREFIQADVDIYGSKSIFYDAEVIACIHSAFQAIGIKEYDIHINNRKALQSKIDELGIPFLTGLEVMRTVDKLDKIGEKGVKELLDKLIGSEKAKGLLEYISSDEPAEGQGRDEIFKLVDYLKDYSITNVKIDNSLVRGLDYYDGNIFEFISYAKEYKGTVSGGGRYDGLGKKFDVEIPVVGGTLGFDRAMEILGQRNKIDFSEKYCIISVDNDKKATEIAMRLRDSMVSTDLILGESLKKALDYCNAKRIRYAVIVGNKDLAEGKVTIRDLKTKEEKKVSESSL